MNINLDLYHIFYMLTTMGSISADVESLCISQPTITFRIKKLEKSIGVSLFTRTKHGIKLK